MKPRTIRELWGTATGPCLIIGNGPSLNDIPDDFLEQYPNFGCNFIPMHRQFRLDHLVMIDACTYTKTEIWECISPSTRVLVFAKAIEFIRDERRKNIIFWANKTEKIPGMTYGNKWGSYFPTSGHAAVWLADYIGYTEFLLVGVDGTKQARHFDEVDSYGRSLIPHFYDDGHEGVQSVLWDMAWGNLLWHMSSKGKPITNLSTRTAMTQLPRERWEDYAKSGLDRRLRSVDFERAV